MRLMLIEKCCVCFVLCAMCECVSNVNTFTHTLTNFVAANSNLCCNDDGVVVVSHVGYNDNTVVWVVLFSV